MVNFRKDNARASVYRMENNTYLDDCLCVVYQANTDEIANNGLTGPDISIYIKTPKSIEDINSPHSLGQSNLFDEDKSVILRIASECQFGTFGDSHCDCESQRIACLDAIKNYGQGIYVHVPQEGQGHGLYYKASELQLQLHGTLPTGEFIGKKDIYEASKALTGSSNVDKRSFGILKTIFNNLGLDQYTYTIISSNPDKTKALAEQVGIAILGAHDVKRELNLDNVGEYLAKIYKKSFALSDDDLRDIYEVLFNAKKIPERVLSLLKYIKDDLALGREFNVNIVLLSKIAHFVDSIPSHTAMTILENASDNQYREFQVELSISNNDIEKIHKKGILKGINNFAFEQNYFYDLVYFKNTLARDLKIRRKSTTGHNRKLIESRLIYKVPVGKNEYEIKNIGIDDREVADLLANSLEGYEVHYVPVFTHTCECSEKYASLLVLIKRYSKSLKTLSIMGNKAEVQRFIDAIASVVKVEIVPAPTNIRTINRDLSLEFDYETLEDEELSFFRKYHKEKK